MLYVVSGFMRTGTSMMMRALEAGGLEAVYSETRTREMNARWGGQDYIPNDEYYELDSSEYMRGDLAQRYDGKLVKCLWGGALRLPADAEYRVIFMRRPLNEIRVSLTAFFGSDAAAMKIRDFDAAMDKVVGILRDRRSMKTVDEVQYHDMLERPYETLGALDWPINVYKAAQIPDLSRARYVANG